MTPDSRDHDSLLTDLREEGDQLERTLEALGATEWELPTPAPGWTIATQIAHLVWTDEVSVHAIDSVVLGEGVAWDQELRQASADPSGFVDAGARDIAAIEPAHLLDRWRRSKAALASRLEQMEPKDRLPWFGPSMSARSMATARFMETWAHSLDVHAALGVQLPVTDRIAHVAHLGVATRAFTFRNRGLQPPPDEVFVRLTAPSGGTWEWGDPGSPQSVHGPAIDFCMVVTQRVHRDDTDLATTGADAEHWMQIAQCFAGPPGTGRTRRHDKSTT